MGAGVLPACEPNPTRLRHTQAMWHMRTIRGLLAFAAALAGSAVVFVQPGVASGDSSSSDHVYGGLIKASFPAGWHVLEHGASLTSQSNSIVYAANQPIHFTCMTTTQGPERTLTECQGPLTRLKSNGVLVRWDANGDPGQNIKKYLGQGRPLTIDGLHASVQITPNGTCYAAISMMGTNSFMQKQEAVGSQETISAVVAGRVPYNYLTFNACIRGPDLPSLTRSVMASLRSTKVL